MYNISCTKYPYVSVIIPVFNDQDGVDNCLASLSEQTWPKNNYEVIVVDNSSIPSIRITKEFSDFSRIVSCAKLGAYSARNAGINASHGEVLAFTDADCIPSNNWIETGFLSLISLGSHCIIGGKVNLELSQRPNTIEHYQCLSGFMQQENIEKLGFSVTANMFTTRLQFQRVGMFDESLFSCGDREWCWRAKKFGYFILYRPEVEVSTLPRRSLNSAIRQVRRVAGGRHALLGMEDSYIDRACIKSHRSRWSATKWIFTHPDISAWKKVRVFCVVAILKVFELIEKIRLHTGSTAERF